MMVKSSDAAQLRYGITRLHTINYGNTSALMDPLSWIHYGLSPIEQTEHRQFNAIPHTNCVQC